MTVFSRRAKVPTIFTLIGLTLSFPLRPTVARRTAMPYHTPQEKKAYENRARQFGRLWLARRKKNVTPQLLQMLDKEPTPGLRQAIVIALGRIEDPQATKPLQNLLVKANAQQPGHIASPSAISLRDDIPPYQIKLALGRIRARDLKGTAKLNAVAKTVGTTWPALKQTAAQLKAKMRVPTGIYEVKDSKQRFILEEFYDVLYRMGKHGEDIQRMGAMDLAIWSTDLQDQAASQFAQEQGKIFTASLSNQAEIDYWFQKTLPPSKAKVACLAQAISWIWVLKYRMCWKSTCTFKNIWLWSRRIRTWWRGIVATKVSSRQQSPPTTNASSPFCNNFSKSMIAGQKLTPVVL